MSEMYDDLINFHGHNCPGLAIGYRMTEVAMNFLFSSPTGEKNLIAIAENVSCGVDALQYLSGCTVGKRNLIVKDYGKQAYTLHDTNTKKSVRVMFNARNLPEDIAKDRNQFVLWLRTAAEEDIISLKEVYIDDLEQPGKFPETVICQACGESVAVNRVKTHNEKSFCIPCFEKA
ncbi:FmdE family protein [Chloroflexota bacterium]